MSTIEKFLTGVVAIGLITTAVLPRRETAKVITAAGNAVSNIGGTFLGTKTKF